MEYQIINIFIKNHAQNVQQKLVPDLFIILVNNPKQPSFEGLSFGDKACVRYCLSNVYFFVK